MEMSIYSSVIDRLMLGENIFPLLSRFSAIAASTLQYPISLPKIRDKNVSLVTSIKLNAP